MNGKTSVSYYYSIHILVRGKEVYDLLVRSFTIRKTTQLLLSMKDI